MMSKEDVGESVELSVDIAQSLVAGKGSQLVVQPRDETEERVLSVQNIEDQAEICQGYYSKLYPIGDGFIALEGHGDSISEAVAFPENHLSEYIRSIFVDEPERFVVNSRVDIGEIEKLIY